MCFKLGLVIFIAIYENFCYDYGFIGGMLWL